MISWFKSVLSKNTRLPEDVDDSVTESINNFYKENPCNEPSLLETVSDPIILGNQESKRTLLLMDDQEIVFYLYNNDFLEMKKRFGYDVLEEFKVVQCEGPDAGFIASKYISTCDDDIVIAILDLTLGKVIRTKKGPVLYDGVDVAIEIINKYTKCKISFCTAGNAAISSLIYKFNKFTGHQLLDYTFSKNEDRVQYLHGLITEVDNGNYEVYKK